MLTCALLYAVLSAIRRKERRVRRPLEPQLVRHLQRGIRFTAMSLIPEACCCCVSAVDGGETGGPVFAVTCSRCGTHIGAYDEKEEVYHFCDVMPSHT